MRAMLSAVGVDPESRKSVLSVCDDFKATVQQNLVTAVLMLML